LGKNPRVITQYPPSAATKGPVPVVKVTKRGEEVFPQPVSEFFYALQAQRSQF
jgi:hypothetical protein